MEYAPDRQPWDQQPGEPALWFKRFRAYRDLSNRSIIEVVRKYSKKPKAQKGRKRSEKARNKQDVPGAWKRKKNEWAWDERANAWDNHILNERERKNEELRTRAFIVLSDSIEACAAKLAEIATTKLDDDWAKAPQIRLAINDVLDRAGVPRTLRKKIEHSGPEGKPIQHDVRGLENMTVDQLLALGDSLDDGDNS